MLFIKNLHKSYRSGNKFYTVLKGIDLSVAKQEFVAVMGPSGSGLMRMRSPKSAMRSLVLSFRILCCSTG